VVFQSRSSAKRKEIFKNIQIEAGVAIPKQLLLNRRVQWSSTYVMLHCAECNKKVNVLVVFTYIN